LPKSESKSNQTDVRDIDVERKNFL